MFDCIGVSENREAAGFDRASVSNAILSMRDILSAGASTLCMRLRMSTFSVLEPP